MRAARRCLQAMADVEGKGKVTHTRYRGGFCNQHLDAVWAEFQIYNMKEGALLFSGMAVGVFFILLTIRLQSSTDDFET